MNQIGNSVSSSPSWLVPTIIGVGGAAIMALCIVFEKCIPYFINSDDSEEEEEEEDTISGNTGSSTNPEAAAAMAELPVFVWEESHEGKDNDRDHFLNKLWVEQSPECAICLTELQKGDLARILPNCNHVFHLKCIDSWIPSRSTCPVCRAAIMPLMRGASSSPSNVLPVFSSSSRTGVFGSPPLQRLRLQLPIEIPPSSPSSSSSSSSPTVYVPPVFPELEPIMPSPLSAGEDSVSARGRS